MYVGIELRFHAIVRDGRFVHVVENRLSRGCDVFN